ncbi:DinB family protein [Streptomyces sp. URMC 126]|uniref:DinB family protein n=1 Tax=Streptomyces sp. URMC 126 TaxID=3423401 RepID=UPI003F1C6A28
MRESNPKANLLRYLQEAREALLWKLDGLLEYDIRRPLTPTGTNLLGLVKHVAGVEAGYFGDTFGRPFFGEEPPPSWWYTEDAEPNSDMWATADESRADIVALYRRAWEHSEGTIAALPLDATGHVPWWPEERREVTLHHVMVRVISDTQRHAGHADILRELVDGSVGQARGKSNLPPGDQVWWEGHRARLERVAREADGRARPGADAGGSRAGAGTGAG